VFTSQREAKRFFVQKVITRATIEAKPLSETEQKMLNFSESDPDFVVDPILIERLEKEISDDEYEAKIAGLLERSYENDVASDKGAHEIYREAYAVLNQGDHYILIMIQHALGRRLRPWWAFWR
jgi:hypothetical protein